MFIIDGKCRLNQFIAKKTFYTNYDFSKTEKAIFTDDIRKITLTYQLQPAKINIKIYKDEVREYPLINVFKIDLENNKKVKNIAELIMHAIPFPSILIFEYDDKQQIWVAHQRTNLNDATKNTIEEMICTNWLNLDDEIFDRLDIKKMRFTDFYSLYSDIVDTICIYNAELRGIVHADSEISGDEAREIVRQMDELDDKITKLKAKIKNETQFNRKVEMNLEIRMLEARRYS